MIIYASERRKSIFHEMVEKELGKSFEILKQSEIKFQIRFRLKAEKHQKPVVGNLRTLPSLKGRSLH